MKNTLLIAVMLAALAGCNTIKGMGQDIKAAGNGIENAASKKGSSNTSNSKPANNAP